MKETLITDKNIDQSSLYSFVTKKKKSLYSISIGIKIHYKVQSIRNNNTQNFKNINIINSIFYLGVHADVIINSKSFF
jgi:flagellar biosynthesis regulator FlaF